MTKFERGDIVHIAPEWLDYGEDPDQDYVVLEDKTDEVFPDGRVDIMYIATDRRMGSISTVSYEMIFKVDHITNFEL